MPHEDVVFRLSEPEDESRLKALLASADLPSQDVSHGQQDYILAVRGGRILGSIGLEKHGEAALLRSFAVVPELRGRGLGSQLYERIIAHARLSGIRAAYVLTTTAERFCAARGFARVDRESVPDALQATPEFRSLCPATAVCMQLRLGDES